MNIELKAYGARGLKVDFPVLDMHAHIGNAHYRASPCMDQQVAEMDRLGIKQAVISSVDSIYGDIRAGNTKTIEAVTRYPEHLLGYCFVGAQYPELILPELERCFALDGFRGIKIYQTGTDFDHPLFAPAFDFAVRHKAPVLAHTWGGNLTGFDRAAARFPDVAFFAAHTGSGYSHEAYIEAALRTPNLYLDLTYSREHTNMIETIVAEVGAERVVWGSDAPTFSMSHQLGKILFARISDGDKKKILYDNAAALLGLEDGA